MRRAHPVLRYGSPRTRLRENDCLGFVRAYFDDWVLVILNVKNPARSAIDPSPEITGSQLKNLLTGDDIVLKDGKISLTVPAMSAAFIGKT